MITAEQADEIAALCDADRYDVAEIGAGAAEIGNPAGAVVKALKAADRRAGAQGRDEPGRRRHRGDARDQARARARCCDDLRGAADAAAQLAEAPPRHADHRPHAAPAGQADDVRAQGRGLDGRARRGRRPPAQRPARLPARRAGRHARTPRYKLRPRPRRAGAAVAHAARPRSASSPARSASPRARSGKAALDVDPAQPVRGGRGARGAAAAARRRCRTSTTPSPRSPRSAARKQAPGLVATLLAAMVQEHERGAGAWHSEWRPLTQLLTATGSAASWLRTSLETLEVDADRMRVRATATPAPPRGPRRQSTGAPMIPHHRVTGPEDAPVARALQLARRDAARCGTRRRRRSPERFRLDPLRHARPRRSRHAARARTRSTTSAATCSTCSTTSASSSAHFAGLSLGGMTGMWLAHQRARAHRQARAARAPRPRWARPRCGSTARRPCASRAPRRSSTATFERWFTEDYRADHDLVGAGARCSSASTTRATPAAARSSSRWT